MICFILFFLLKERKQSTDNNVPQCDLQNVWASWIGRKGEYSFFFFWNYWKLLVNPESHNLNSEFHLSNQQIKKNSKSIFILVTRCVLLWRLSFVFFKSQHPRQQTRKSGEKGWKKTVWVLQPSFPFTARDALDFDLFIVYCHKPTQF